MKQEFQAEATVTKPTPTVPLVPQATVTEPDGKNNLINWNHPAKASLNIVDRERGVVKANPQRKSVAIVGYAASTRSMAPFNNPEFEIWGLNQLNRFITRADRWFEMHQEWNEHVVEGTDHEQFITNLPIPCYMPKIDPSVKNSVCFPKDILVQEFGIEYFTSTIAEMLALAIYEGFTRIDLYGIDLIVGDEYTYQKPCAEFWLGIASAKGIHVNIPPTSALLTSRFSYGYQEPGSVPLATSLLRNRLMKAKEQQAKLNAELDTIHGAIQVLESIIYAQEIWEKGGDTSII